MKLILIGYLLLLNQTREIVVFLCVVVPKTYGSPAFLVISSPIPVSVNEPVWLSHSLSPLMHVIHSWLRLESNHTTNRKTIVDFSGYYLYKWFAFSLTISPLYELNSARQSMHCYNTITIWLTAILTKECYDKLSFLEPKLMSGDRFILYLHSNRIFFKNIYHS